MVKVIKVDSLAPEISAMRMAAAFARFGMLVVFPTDTVYGLGTNPFNVLAVDRLLKVKGRLEEMGVPLLVSSVDDVSEIAHFDDDAEKLAKKFWPGVLTLVLKKRRIIPNIVTGGRDSVAVRIPSHKVARSLAQMVGGVIVGTSANISGKSSPKTAQEAIEQVGKEVDLVLDGGKASVGVSSTIIDLTESPPLIRRLGAVSEEQIKEVIGDVVRQLE
ncbi:MAG: L-threonylcarbamoyladenylate synthase [Candidatus Hodarchaeota archaeon]